MTEERRSTPASGVSRIGSKGSAVGHVDSSPTCLPIVGIAAAAGGLEAVGHVVRDLPKSLPTAYVLVQQLPAAARSPIPALLADETELDVVQLEGDVLPEPGRIYVPPPGMDAVIEGDRICVRPPAPGREILAPSADRLFGSLASERGAAATGIVLSGVGGDGSYGAQALREAGGVTIAQAPESARHDGMPLSAIRTGCVDLVLAPQEIGAHLVRLAASAADRAALSLEADRRGPLSELMDLLLASTGVDFRDYRDNTVRRRLARRMAALAIDRLATYVAYCRKDSTELEALHSDLLISVTRFFRDREAFSDLGGAIQRMMESQPAEQPIRVWVAGCATGEEAYSVAILVVEALGGLQALPGRQVQIFATDIDDRALDVARRGIYPLSALDDVPVDYAGDYFVNRRGMVEIAPALRRLVRFSHHNVFQDPPFLNLDLVSLRNVLIYFKQPLQERVLARMHYALRTGGMLALGASETLNALPMPFQDDPDSNFLVKTEDTPMTVEGMGLGTGPLPVGLPALSSDVAEPVPGDTQADQMMFERLARSIAPNGFVMNRAQEIVRVLGDISAVTGLEETVRPALDSSILKGPLREDVSRLVPIALRARNMREGPWHPLEDRGEGQEVRLDAYPIADADGVLSQVLFAVRRRTTPLFAGDPAEMTATESAEHIEELGGELRAAKSALRQTVEELRTYNEELHSVNEELQSSNEELQAVNEELETANEELQSTNEELITVNEEMQVKASALRAANQDLDAIMRALPLAVIVVDESLSIRRASQRARDLFRIPTQGNDPVSLAQCALPEGFPLLTALARETFKTDEPRSLRLRTGAIMRQLRIAPYSSTGGSRRKVMLILSEIELDHPDSPDLPFASHWSFDIDTERCFWSADPSVRDPVVPASDMTPGQDWAAYMPEDRDLLKQAFSACRDKGESYSLPVRLAQPDGSILPVRSEGVAVRDASGRIATVVGTIREIGLN